MIYSRRITQDCLHYKIYVGGQIRDVLGLKQTVANFSGLCLVSSKIPLTVVSHREGLLPRLPLILSASQSILVSEITSLNIYSWQIFKHDGLWIQKHAWAERGPENPTSKRLEDSSWRWQRRCTVHRCAWGMGTRDSKFAEIWPPASE